MHPLGRKRDLFDAISCFVRGYNYMAPFVFEEYVISDNAVLTIIDIENIDEATKAALDANFVLICEGNSGSSLSTVKMRVRNLFSSKNPEWIMGAPAEFFVHLYIRLAGFKQECLFLNLEENSIKKGFDGYYSKEGLEWLMESKAGSIDSKDISHAGKVNLAMNDLSAKVSGRDKSGKKELPNNPWQEAYSHANQYDVGTAANIRKNIKELADDFTNGKFRSIEEFNTMPCGTVFLSGIWSQPDHNLIKGDIKRLSGKLKGKQIHVICVTHRSTDLFIKYIESE